jgi:hypothetical protein
MKSTLKINWILSMAALGSINTEASSLAAVLTVFAWFAASSLVIIHTGKKKKNEHGL